MLQIGNSRFMRMGGKPISKEHSGVHDSIKFPQPFAMNGLAIVMITN